MHALHLCSIEGMAAQTVKPNVRNPYTACSWAWPCHRRLARRRAGGVRRAAARPAGAGRSARAARPGAWPGAVQAGRRGRGTRLAWPGPAAPVDRTARGLGRRCGTVRHGSPRQWPSWRSLLACGFAVRALQYRYGGHARYLLARLPGAALATGRPPGAGAGRQYRGQEARWPRAGRASPRARRQAACAWWRRPEAGSHERHVRRAAPGPGFRRAGA